MLPPDLPPVTNRVLYAYRVFMKCFSFFAFGLISLIVTILIFPPMRLFLHPRDRFSKYARRFVSSSMRGYIIFMHIIGIVNINPGNRESYRQLSSKIIVANHPSILDIVMLLSLLPNADCIANAYLNHSILRWVVRQLYILSSLDFNEIIRNCTSSLERGNCLIVFPEGTRTPRTGKNIVKKGAARIALATGFGIIPVNIGGTVKYGIGKKDPWLSFNPTERYVYNISMGTEISPEKYKSLPIPAAVRALTKEMSAFLFPAKERRNLC
ncbi:MAG: 1-acyl-sn-glycerol-3-phosphate acyltransferase [Treponema sp.]|jgi:1-acyl-sn-glycerol-3-phosphate acyltransferase|nr:1-acyl-sn-glycerol-3-phosphate acyltransferase [Treponema sp.]